MEKMMPGKKHTLTTILIMALLIILMFMFAPKGAAYSGSAEDIPGETPGGVSLEPATVRQEAGYLEEGYINIENMDELIYGLNELVDVLLQAAEDENETAESLEDLIAEQNELLELIIPNIDRLMLVIAMLLAIIIGGIVGLGFLLLWRPTDD